MPLPFPVTPVRIPYSSALIGYVVRGLAARYPTLAIGEFGRSVLGKPLWYLTLGSGEKCVFYNAAHHANEWITTPLLLTFCEQLCARLGDGGELGGQNHPRPALEGHACARSGGRPGRYRPCDRRTQP